MRHINCIYLTWCECCVDLISGDLIREELINGQLNVAHVTVTAPLHLR